MILGDNVLRFISVSHTRIYMNGKMRKFNLTVKHFQVLHQLFETVRFSGINMRKQSQAKVLLRNLFRVSIKNLNFC